MMCLSLVLSFIAFMHFALSVGGNYKKHYAVAMPRRAFYCLQVLAWAFLLVSIYPCVKAWEAEIGITLWLGLISISALLVLMLLNFLPRMFARLWSFCPGALVHKVAIASTAASMAAMGP